MLCNKRKAWLPFDGSGRSGHCPTRCGWVPLTRKVTPLQQAGCQRGSQTHIRGVVKRASLVGLPVFGGFLFLFLFEFCFGGLSRWIGSASFLPSFCCMVAEDEWMTFWLMDLGGGNHWALGNSYREGDIRAGRMGFWLFDRKREFDTPFTFTPGVFVPYAAACLLGVITHALAPHAFISSPCPSHHPTTLDLSSFCPHSLSHPHPEAKYPKLSHPHLTPRPRTPPPALFNHHIQTSPLTTQHTSSNTLTIVEPVSIDPISPPPLFLVSVLNAQPKQQCTSYLKQRNEEKKTPSSQ